MNRLRETRFKKSKTQIQLFKVTGIWPSRISYIENGYMEAKEEEKKKLSEALGVEKNWLFPEEGKE
jgi:transcriptional regulator with XRE-family HTH domain